MNKHLLILLIGLALFGLSIITFPATKLLYLHGPEWMGGIEAEMKVSAVILVASSFVGAFVAIALSMVR